MLYTLRGITKMPSSKDIDTLMIYYAAECYAWAPCELCNMNVQNVVQYVIIIYKIKQIVV